MKYMLLIYGAESSWTEGERHACMIESMGICKELEVEGKWVASPDEHKLALAESIDLCHRLHDEGKYISAAPLHPPETAKCVRVRDGHPFKLLMARLKSFLLTERLATYFTTFHPSIGFTVAQLGPPSLPVPGIVACSNRFGLSTTDSIISHVIPCKGILIRRCQQLSICPAYFPMSM